MRQLFDVYLLICQINLVNKYARNARIARIYKKNAEKATQNLLPNKSKTSYEKQYENFKAWQLNNKVPTVNETVLLAYFQELSEKYAPTSLWTKYSLLKTTLIVNMGIDISNYKQLISYLKVKSKGYVTKKSQVLTGEQVLTFIKNVPDNLFLLHKVVLIMGVFGGLRRDEMVKMSIDDISDKVNFLIVKVPETKTAVSKGFSIVEEEEIGALKLVRKYMALRPKHMKEPRFFLTYRNGRCTVQPVGKNTLGGVPQIIAKYLKLDNPQQFTGHCLRRTSSTLLIEAGASFETLKIHGKWKSNTVAQSYVEESTASKNRICNMIASAVSSLEREISTNICEPSETNILSIDDPKSPSSNPVINKNIQLSKNLSTKPISFSGTFENCTFYVGK